VRFIKLRRDRDDVDDDGCDAGGFGWFIDLISWGALDV